MSLTLCKCRMRICIHRYFVVQACARGCESACVRACVSVIRIKQWTRNKQTRVSGARSRRIWVAWTPTPAWADASSVSQTTDENVNNYFISNSSHLVNLKPHPPPHPPCPQFTRPYPLARLSFALYFLLPLHPPCTSQHLPVTRRCRQMWSPIALLQLQPLTPHSGSQIRTQKSKQSSSPKEAHVILRGLNEVL